jgi:anhydro-N-acetylmuramic acid kinase
MLSIGLMSGTSMDGIDASLLETDGSANLIKDLGHTSITYSQEFKILLKGAEYAVRQCVGDLTQAKTCYAQMLAGYLINELKIENISETLAQLSSYLYGVENAKRSVTLDDVIEHSTRLHHEAVIKLLKKTGYKAKQIDVIGYHGQTMFHRPSIRVSVAVGNSQSLADKLGITVVSQFRNRDVAAGGEGAPFAPLYHQALAIRDKKVPVAIVNCGGIANITIISSASAADLIAFDTGPGNGLIDRLVKQRTQGKETMDTDGKYGKRGVVNEKMLASLYEKSILKDGKNYFLESPPKSLDIGDMTLIPELALLSLADACATLETFTADTIVSSFKLLRIELPEHWILAGGGWRNPVIFHALESRLKNLVGEQVNILTADKAGWNAQAMEAQIFAYHAVRSLQNKPLSMPGTTRVPTPLSGGQAHVPSTGATRAVEKLIKKNPSVISDFDI